MFRGDRWGLLATASLVYTSPPLPPAPSRASRTPVSASCSVPAGTLRCSATCPTVSLWGLRCAQPRGTAGCPGGPRLAPTITELTEHSPGHTCVCSDREDTGPRAGSQEHTPQPRRPQVAPSGRGRACSPPLPAMLVWSTSLRSQAPRPMSVYLHVALPCPRVPPAGHRACWTTASPSSSQPLTSAAHTRGAGG